MRHFARHRLLVIVLLAAGIALGAWFFATHDFSSVQIKGQIVNGQTVNQWTLSPGETVNVPVDEPSIITCPTQLPPDGALFASWAHPYNFDTDLGGELEGRTGGLLIYEYDIDVTQPGLPQTFAHEKNMSLLPKTRWSGASYGYPESKNSFLYAFSPGRTYYVLFGTGAYVDVGGGILQRANYAPFSCTIYTDGCFTAGTPVTLADGRTAPIESLRNGDHVLGWDPATQQNVPATVAETYKRTVVETLILHTKTTSIHTTGEHPFWSRGTWVLARDLSVGDLLMHQNGAKESITSIERIPGAMNVYNLTVDGVHTYFANGVLVHNKSFACNYDGSCNSGENCTCGDCPCTEPGTSCGYNQFNMLGCFPPSSSSSTSSSSNSNPPNSSSSAGTVGSSSGGGSVSISVNTSLNSCPFVYAWDGNKYVLETEGIPFSPFASLKDTSHERLASLKPDADGTLKVRVSEERQETSYLDAAVLRAVDIDAASPANVTADVHGNLHTIDALESPARCVTTLGDDCTEPIGAKDKNLVSFDLNALLAHGDDLTHAITLTFKKPKETVSAKLLLNVESAPAMDGFVRYAAKHLGKTGFTMFDDFFVKAGLQSTLDQAFKDSAFYLAVDVQDGDGWRTVDYVKPGNYRGWDDFLVPLTFSASDDDTVTVRLRSLGFYIVDFAGLDWSDDLPMQVATLPMQSSTNQMARSALQADDGTTLNLVKGQSSILLYKDPESMPGKKRSYVFSLTGHYIADLPERSMSDTVAAVSEYVHAIFGGTQGINEIIRQYLLSSIVYP